MGLFRPDQAGSDPAGVRAAGAAPSPFHFGLRRRGGQDRRRLRSAFFRDARDVCSTGTQAEIAGELGLPIRRLRSEMENGRAFAALFADVELQKQHLIQGSPTFLLNEGRQKLYGNVGYRVIRANLEELLESSEELASWC